MLQSMGSQSRTQQLNSKEQFRDKILKESPAGWDGMDAGRSGAGLGEGF